MPMSLYSYNKKLHPAALKEMMRMSLGQFADILITLLNQTFPNRATKWVVNRFSSLAERLIINNHARRLVLIHHLC